jgi:integrase
LNYLKHLKAYWGDVIVQDMDNDMILRFQGRQKEQGYSNRTVNIHVGLVRKIYKYAKVKKTLRFPMLLEAKKKHIFLAPGEYHRLIKNFDEKAELAYLRTVFGRHTGMRPKELSYLAWTDINMEMETARVSGKPEYEFYVKDNEERDIHLDDTAMEILRTLQKRRRGRWVFSTDDVPVLRIDRALRTAAEKARIKKVTPNMLRHTFAVHFLLAGGDLASLQKFMGHSSIETTNRYVDAVDEYLKKSSRKIGEMDKKIFATIPPHHKSEGERGKP